MYVDYEKLLERGMKKVPKEKGSGERFEMPRAKVLISGSRTSILNFSEIASILRRDPKHVMKFLLKELATKGEIEGAKATFQGVFSDYVINNKIESYTKTYVICPECGKPDSKLLKLDRQFMFKCEACGAKHPVSKV
jgi:translation initiation factor 2 subunit 2